MPNAESTYTWETVLAAVPAPTQEASNLYALTTAPADLIEQGARIRTEKILTDLVRWSGQVAEFMPKATPAQRRLLLGYSDGFFRVAVHEGVKLRAMLASRAGNVDDREAARIATIGAASQAYTDGADERERLTVALEGLRRYDSGLQDRVDLARGSVADADSLVRSLRALVKLARVLLQDSTSIIAQQLVDGGVTAEELDHIDAVAGKVESTAAAAAGARAQGSVSQADLDQQDGVCLAHMGRLMRIFNGAHEKDPAIPQLVANATRRIFSPNRKRPGEAAADGGKGEAKEKGEAAPSAAKEKTEPVADKGKPDPAADQGKPEPAVDKGDAAPT